MLLNFGLYKIDALIELDNLSSVVVLINPRSSSYIIGM